MIALTLAACFPPTTPSTTKSPTGPVEDTARGDSGTTGSTPPTLPTGDSATTTDSGGWPTCAPDVVALPTAVCAERAPALVEAEYSVDVTVTGAVTAVGGDLEPVRGSVPPASFSACLGLAHLVRLVDDLGNTWTIGWDVPGPADDGSTGAVGLGNVLTLRVFEDSTEYGRNQAVALLDPGPVVFVESFGYIAPPLTDAERGGLSPVVPYRGPGCIGALEPYDAILLRAVPFYRPSGVTVVDSGATAIVPLADRELSLVLAESFWKVGCGADACARNTWVGWATSF